MIGGRWYIFRFYPSGWIKTKAPSIQDLKLWIKSSPSFWARACSLLEFSALSWTIQSQVYKYKIKYISHIVIFLWWLYRDGWWKGSHKMVATYQHCYSWSCGLQSRIYGYYHQWSLQQRWSASILHIRHTLRHCLVEKTLVGEFYSLSTFVQCRTKELLFILSITNKKRDK